MDVTSRLLHQIHARYAPVDARVAEILDHIRADCNDLDLKKCNEDNERQLEQFIARVDAEFPGRALWVANHVGITLTAIMLLEVAILLHLMARRIPAWIDNSYKHASQADNLASLKRIRHSDSAAQRLAG